MYSIIHIHLPQIQLIMKPTILLGRLLICLLTFSSNLFAQAPTSLQYPTTNIFSANSDNVFLSPTVSGNVVSYSINPTLPAGLSFNTNTGVISGIGTTASPATVYTVTATNGSGSAVVTLSIQVINFYYNNANSQVSFLAANTVPKVGNGQTAGNIVLFTNVTTVSGQSMDCIVTTVSVNNVSSWDAYDQAAASGPNFNSNSDNFFSPQVTFGNSPGGSIQFEFQFILGGSYNNGTNTGINVVLQNVYLNTYDIDGNGTAIQNNEFAGFSVSELGNPTNQVVTFNPVTDYTRFTSNTATNTPTVTDPRNRIRVSYTNISKFNISVAADNAGLAFYFLDFSSGPVFGAITSTSAPSLDLNTVTTGVNNSNEGCGSTLPFSGGGGQTNATSPTNLTEFILKFPTSQIVNGANERLVIAGATSGGTIPLNFANGAAIPNVVFGTTITYAVTAIVAGGISNLNFIRTSGSSNFTIARAEGLVDAMQYQNIAASPTNGDRDFTVNIRTALYKSPAAIFKARLNCVSISGNIYHDANALTDNSVNPNSTSGQFADNSIYAVLVDPVTNLVIATRPIISSAYNFGNVTAGKYNILFSNGSAPGTGTNFTSSTLPANYVSTGENLGTGTGNDLGVDGKLVATVGSITVTNANFGLQLPPTASGVNQASSLNPGGFNLKTVPASAFGNTDVDGTVSSITITTFPTNANVLKIGSTIYTNGGTCPPQSTCTAWPGTVTVLVTGGIPTSVISVDPVNGAGTVNIPYYVTDNGGANSGSSSINVPFTTLGAPLTISGNVWRDGNGNAVLDGTETLTNVANSGEILYAVLVQTSNTYSGAATVYATVPVNATTGYTFADVPAGNDYQVRIISLTSSPTDGVASSIISPQLAIAYTGVSTNNSGTTTSGLNTNNLINTITGFNASVSNVNFGIETEPTSTDATHLIAQPGTGTTKSLTPANGMSALAGADPEDGAKGSGSTLRITSLAGMQGNQLRYNGVLITAGTTISNYDPNLLTITFSGAASTAASFNFVFVDNAGISDSSPATYTISWSYTLPVVIVSFEATLSSNNTVAIKWQTAEESQIDSYVIQRSQSNANWINISTHQAVGSSFYNGVDLSPVNGLNFYRLMIVSTDGSIKYSSVRKVIVGINNQKVVIWPNPVTTVLTVSPGNNELNKIELVNAGGQIVITRTITGITDLDIQQLNKGIYYIRIISTDNKVSVHKVVIN